jgi:hypothetical protein
LISINMAATPAKPVFVAESSTSTWLADEPLEDTLSLGEAVPSEQQFLHTLPIPAPLLDLVVVAPVSVERVVSFSVGSVVGDHQRI